MIAREVLIGPAAAPVARLLLGDAYAIRPTLGWMDADVMDPPYAFDNSGGGAWRAARGASDQIVEEGLTEGFDHAIINPLLTGAVVVFCHNDQLADLLPFLRGTFHRHALCVWCKEAPAPHANRHYLADLEPYVHAWNRGYHPQGEYWDKSRAVTGRSMPAKVFGHPTVKPLKVMAKIIANVAGHRICDPFMGTGSTGVAAIRAGRHFTGIEHNPAHFETAVQRITDAWRQLEAEAATTEQAA